MKILHTVIRSERWHLDCQRLINLRRGGGATFLDVTHQSTKFCKKRRFSNVRPMHECTSLFICNVVYFLFSKQAAAREESYELMVQNLTERLKDVSCVGYEHEHKFYVFKQCMPTKTNVSTPDSQGRRWDLLGARSKSIQPGSDAPAGFVRIRGAKQSNSPILVYIATVGWPSVWLPTQFKKEKKNSAASTNSYK